MIETLVDFDVDALPSASPPPAAADDDDDEELGEGRNGLDDLAGEFFDHATVDAVPVPLELPPPPPLVPALLALPPPSAVLFFFLEVLGPLDGDVERGFVGVVARCGCCDTAAGPSAAETGAAAPAAAAI